MNLPEIHERIAQLEEALMLMVYQYCVTEEQLDHRYMCAGEHALAALGLRNGDSVDVLEEMLKRAACNNEPLYADKACQKENERESDSHHLIEQVKSELTYYASRYRNDGTNGHVLPGTDSAIQKAIIVICCMENQICKCKKELVNEKLAPKRASRLPEAKMDLAGLSRYARDKGVSVRDLSEEEKNRFGVFTREW